MSQGTASEKSAPRIERPSPRAHEAALDAIAVVDLGGQYCHMIGRRLRDIGVRADIFAHDAPLAALAGYAGIILSGGPQSVYDERSLTIDRSLLELGRPVLGICYGHQLLAKLLGSTVAPGSAEYGKSTLHLENADSLFEGTPASQTVWMSHADSVRGLPKGVVPLARTDACEVAAFGDVARKLFGVQFHPEVAHTECGTAVLRNFSFKVCGIRHAEKLKDRVAHLLEQIRARTGSRSVFFFVSGGVDSTVAFTLCARALPKGRVLGVYVDTGLMRKHETGELRALLAAAGLSDRLRIRDESKRFLEALRDVSDPEAKRHVIGRLFVEVQQAAMHEYGIDGGDWLLGQGTIYPDTVESGGSSGATALIKTHHNRCEEIRQLIAAGKVIEPLSEFYKDEVREIGAELGLDARLTGRWPFPGPGLAIRCLSTSAPPRPVAAVELPERFRGYDAVRVPLRSVGVQGDGRTYRDVLAVKGPLDYMRLGELGTSMCNVGRDYNRVIALVAGAAGALQAGFVAPAAMTRERLDLLRDADDIAKRVMESAGLMDAVWQFPVVLIPVSFGRGETVVLRPVNSEDGMTANFARLPVEVLKCIGDEAAKLPGVDAVFLDVTDKPPATIEWE